MIDWYLLASGILRLQPSPATSPARGLPRGTESWFAIRGADPDEIRAFLKPLDLHPLALERCAVPAHVPGAIVAGAAILIEFPAGFEIDATTPTYVTFLLQGAVLVTIQADSTPELDAVAKGLVVDGAPQILHLAQVVYELIDALTDSRVKAEIDLRDRVQRMSRAFDESPGTVLATDLRRLHWDLGALVSLIENQLYCVAALDASDNEALRKPHQRAFVQDLVSELELAQRGVYHLEARVGDLDSAFQLASSGRVERRLRTLTIISAVTLPLGLIAGLLGMNVGGVPGVGAPNGFLVVTGLMAAIVGAEIWFFRRSGWFE